MWKSRAVEPGMLYATFRLCFRTELFKYTPKHLSVFYEMDSCLAFLLDFKLEICAVLPCSRNILFIVP